ncbi:MAG: hypothetical protein ACJ78Q_18120 [Chloroflexia bacterium]
MDKISMTEPTARFTSLAACGLSMFAAVAAMLLGMRNSQGPAALFLGLAFVGCLVTLVSYRRYAMLRQKRWRRELARTENELNQVLNHTRMNIIMEHTTGPLAQAGVGADDALPAGEEPPVAHV